MSTDAYQEILRKAREELSDQERRRLAQELQNISSQKEAKPLSIFESMQQRGLLGQLTDAPADLSTNPVHIEGFGHNAE